MVIKLKKIYYVFFAAGLVLIIFLCSAFADNSVVSMPVTDRVIIIDAGHGGLDGGAVSSDGVQEKNINLDIAKRLKVYLEHSGAKVLMTREKDISLHKNDDESIKNKKRSDLNTRREMVNNSDAEIFVSIHLNFFEQSKYKGAQVFYEKLHPESVKLAGCIQSEMKEALDKENKRMPAKIGDDKMLFRNLKIPSVIVECGFLSNPSEAMLLNTPEYRQKVAYSIYMGIMDYFSV